jgi:hypothetical protein
MQIPYVIDNQDHLLAKILDELLAEAQVMSLQRHQYRPSPAGGGKGPTILQTQSFKLYKTDKML